MSKHEKLEELMARLTETDRRREELSKTARAIREKRRALHDELKKCILAGETTGDPIDDYVISLYGHPSGEIADAYRALKNRVDACTGEPVLIVEARRESVLRYVLNPGPCADDYTILKQTWRFGILTGPLILPPGESRWKFPTLRFANWDPNCSAERIRFENGSLAPLCGNYFPAMMQETVRSSWMGSVELPKLRFVIGWEELDAFGDSPEGDMEACAMRLRENGCGKHENMLLLRSERLLMLLNALEVEVPSDMPKLRAYRDGHAPTLLCQAEKALRDRAHIIEDFASGRLAGADIGRLLAEIHDRLRSFHACFRKFGVTGDTPLRVARVVTELDAKKTAE